MSLLDRAFARRPFVSGNPLWGQAVSDLWAETSVTFVRDIQTDNGAGDFSASPSAAFLTIMCHVEVETKERPYSGELASGPSAERFWTIYMPIWDRFGVEVDPALFPIKGNRVQFTTDDGHPIDLPIEYVHSPDSILDHLEVETVEFQ